MKPPVKIEDLMEEWRKDSKIDETEVSKEIARIPSLHSKYAVVMSHHNLLVKKYTFEYNKLRKIKWEYLLGYLNDPESLQKYGLEPMVKKVLRQDVPIYLDGDQELINVLLKKNLHEEIVDFCKGVIKEVGNRSWQLKTYVDYERFIAGH
jgi:hypothetical protein